MIGRPLWNRGVNDVFANGIMFAASMVLTPPPRSSDVAITRTAPRNVVIDPDLRMFEFSRRCRQQRGESRPDDPSAS
jgi:hypothetical protein